MPFEYLLKCIVIRPFFSQLKIDAEVPEPHLVNMADTKIQRIVPDVDVQTVMLEISVRDLLPQLTVCYSGDFSLYSPKIHITESKNELSSC